MSSHFLRAVEHERLKRVNAQMHAALTNISEMLADDTIEPSTMVNEVRRRAIREARAAIAAREAKDD
jgi:hypothetical protein